MWIELGTDSRLPRLVNLVVPRPGVKFKQSSMPFVQMENISIFLRACQAPPLNLHQHDTFLTVDLFEQKDPAQVLQCLGAFSRAANAASPSRFPSVIGPRARGNSSVVSPQGTGGPGAPATPSRGRGISVTSNTSHGGGGGGSRPLLSHNQTGDSGSGRRSPTKSPTHNNNGPGSPGAVSSWSRREHEGATSPAWNIAQYGYMGGASQGNLGIAFGARRQITSSAPSVPSLAEKERLRKEKEAEEARLLAEEQQRKAELEEEERLARLEEERKWEEETRRLRDEEKRKAEEEKRRWEEEERQWKITEEKRRKEEEEVAAARLDEDRQRTRSHSDARLRGQFLSQYQAEQASSGDGGDDERYKSRVKELERELELARQREAEYERERQGRPPSEAREARDTQPQQAKARARSRSRPADTTPSRQDSWSRDEREVLHTEWNRQQQQLQEPRSAKPAVSSPLAPAKSPRPLPDPTAAPPIKPQNTGGRPLPDPAAYKSPPRPVPTPPSRTDRFLTEQEAPAPAQTKQTYSRELGATAEQDAENRRRVQSQTATKAGGWASKSLLEREMEMERQRQREWEEAQKETAAAVRSGEGMDGIGGGIGGKWDVNQWTGFTGGDGQNKGGQGIGAGRRQIVGPRPLPGPPK